MSIDEQNALRELRERCIDMAIRSDIVGLTGNVVATAQTYFDFITGSKDAAVLTAAKEFAEKVTAQGFPLDGSSEPSPLTTATGYPLSSSGA